GRYRMRTSVRAEAKRRQPERSEGNPVTPTIFRRKMPFGRRPLQDENFSSSRSEAQTAGTK
ncbi:hypothetical protein, partial [Roseibacillus ishigakijimensis]|uniref:hypothetical protein n=1 Tax=Roseibacillus ishigakijimensis TaxID=454146 RepID=UPI00363B5CE2